MRSLWRLRRYLRPHAHRMLAMLTAACAGVGLAIAVPLVAEALVNGPIAEHRTGRLLPIALLALGLGIGEAVAIFTRRWVQATTVVRIESRIRDDFYQRLQRLSVAFHDRWQSGQLLSRAVTDLATLRRFSGYGLVFLVVNTLTYVTVVVLLVHLYAPLGLLVAATTVPIIVLSARFEREYIEVSRLVQDQQGDLATVAEESAQGVRVIKAFGRRGLVGRRFDARATALYGTSLAKVRIIAKFWTLLDLVPNVTLSIVVLVGALAVADGALSVGGLVAFMALLLLLVWPVQALGEILATAQESMTAADRLYEVFDTAPEILDPPHPVALPAPHGRLAFERVGFAYPGQAGFALHDVNLVVEPGETVAIVGATGSGKSTLTALVPRLYDVTAGRITLDGVDVRDLDLARLREVVAVAFEEPVLFSASVRENLLLGAPEASDADVAAAVELAQASFLYDLPWGLETRVGEQGMRLSGGQRQRLALARAVVGRPRVLVLDDPLSALDVHTEALVEEALRRMLAGTTGLVVVHRPSTIALADRVALLEDGTITAVGTHHELLERVPSYRAILAQDAWLDDVAAAG